MEAEISPDDFDFDMSGETRDPKKSTGLLHKYSLTQWLNFKFSGITCLVGKMKFQHFQLLSQGPMAE